MELAAGRAGLLHDHAKQLMELLEVDATVGRPKNALDVARLDEASCQFAAGTTETVEGRSDQGHAERRQVHLRRRRRQFNLGRLNELADLGAVLAEERGEAFLVGSHDLFETVGHSRSTAGALKEHRPQTVGVPLGVAEVILQIVVVDDAGTDDEQHLAHRAREVDDLGDVVAGHVQQQTQSRQLSPTREVIATPPVEHGGRADLAGLTEVGHVVECLEGVLRVVHQVFEALTGRASEACRRCFCGLHYLLLPSGESELTGLELRGTASLAGVEPAYEEVLQVRGDLLATSEFLLDEGPVDASQLALDRRRDLQEQRVTAVPEVLVVGEQQCQRTQEVPARVLRPRALSLEGEALVGEAEEGLDVPDERLLSVLDSQDADVVDGLRNRLLGAAVDGRSHLQHHLECDEIVRTLVLVALNTAEQRELLSARQLHRSPGLRRIDECPDGQCCRTGDEIVAHPDLRPDLGVAVVELVEDLALQLLIGVDVDDHLERTQLITETLLLGLEGRGDALEAVEQCQRTGEPEVACSVELAGSDLDAGAAQTQDDPVRDTLGAGHCLDQFRLLGAGAEQHVALVVRHEHGLVLRGLEVAGQNRHGLAVQRFLALDSTADRGGGGTEPTVRLFGEERKT